MKVHTLKSLGAKLFYLTAALVLITVIGNSWQFFRTFRSYQLQQLEDSLQGQAERSRDQVENVLDSWRSQLAVALPTLRGNDIKDPLTALQRFVDANQEFVFIQLFSAPSIDAVTLRPLGEAATLRHGDKNFEDKDAAKAIQAMKEASTLWLKSQIPHLKKTNYAVESLAKAVGLPVMTNVIRFDVLGSKEVVWAVLGTWQNNVMRALLKSGSLNSSLLDARGHIFASLEPGEMQARRLFGSKTLLKKVLSNVSPSGFESEYKDNRGHARVGAYARLPRFNLTIVLEQDADLVTQTVNKTLVSTSLWAALFILFALLFSFFGAASITKGLRAVAYATGRIANGDLNYKVPPSSKDEVGALGRAVNHMSGKMIELMRAQVDKARFEKELETAKIVQSTFFPKDSIARPQLDVSGFYTPASECGGDLWGHFTIADGVEFVYIADAMGHGAPAALVTAIAYSTTMTVADIIRHDPSYRDSPAALLERINRIIFEAVSGSISMTFFASIIDLNEGTMTYANAGHNFPVVLPLSPTDPRLGKAPKSTLKGGGVQPITLKLMGTPLGLDPATTFKEQTFSFQAGDKICYFTDGLIECASPKGEQWGRKHLLAAIGKGAKLTAKDLCDDLVNQAFHFFGGVPLADDITVVIAEVGRNWKKAQKPAEVLAEQEQEDKDQEEEQERERTEQANDLAASEELELHHREPTGAQAELPSFQLIKDLAPVASARDSLPELPPASEDGAEAEWVPTLRSAEIDELDQLVLEKTSGPAQPEAVPVAEPAPVRVPPRAGNRYKLKLPKSS